MTTQPASARGTTTHTDVSRVQQRLRAVLEGAEPRRAQHTRIVDRGAESHPLWVFDERDLLTTAVNQVRARHGLTAVTSDEVREVEVTAVGHSDYAHKLTWRLAELACGLDGAPTAAGVAAITRHGADD